MMEMLWAAVPRLLRRDDDDPTQELLKLLQDPFAGQLVQNSIWYSLGFSIGFTAIIAICFSFIRPYNTVVYAPKLKHADEKHAPPPLGRGMFAWVGPLWKTTEQDMITLTGMDATLFMRFTRMLRNMLLLLSLIACGVLIPVNYSQSVKFDSSTWLSLITPSNVYGQAQWAQVVVAWLTNVVVCFFLWWNYRAVLRLRKQYFQSLEYQQSLHARTLMLYDLPKGAASDQGIATLIDVVAPSSSFSRTVIARNVKILPELIAEHDKAVRKLEEVLAKYLKDPQNLPPARPLCKPSKRDRSYETYARGQKVDAIEYLTKRIKDLEIEIKEVRASVDKRSTMSYGFASFADIAEAHEIAFAAKKKKINGAIIKLAPRPSDIIWDNMPLSSPVRSRRRLWNNMWIALLTALWIVPNALIAIFLVNLGNLGRVWPAFQDSLKAIPTFWSIVQGIANPALTSLIYLLLPIFFRKLAMRAGDQTKTGRERHVIAKLYSFFVFNNLIVFSVFSAIWTFVAGVIEQTQSGTDTWQAIVKENFGQTVFLSMCSISPFWINWLLQRQLGIAIDLAQLWTLFYGSIRRKFFSPTPRELIELTAPPPFDYASYYNYFLFYATVALCYAPVQPLVLPAAALYFVVDVALRKYLLLYIFVTKTESGGMAWRVLFNRLIFGTVLANLVVFLTVWVRGEGTHLQAYAVAPLPFLMIAFKFYCSRVFDDKIQFYSTRNVRGAHHEGALNVKEQSARNDRLAARFGHPALYKPLITPMVHAKAQNILASIYQGRLTDGREAFSGDSMSVSGYSDTYIMDPMNSGKPGKALPAGMPGFEIVPESRLDFEYYKNRDEFAEDHGAGELFGKASDIVRTGTPGTYTTGPGSEGGSRPGTPAGGMGFSRGPGPTGPPGRQFSTTMDGASTAYNRGNPYDSPPLQPTYQGQPVYASPPLGPIASPVPQRSRSQMYGLGTNDSGSNLVHNAAGMSVSPPPLPTPGSGPGSAPGSARDFSSGGERMPAGTGLGHPRAPGMFGGGPYGYGNLPQTEDDLPSPPAPMPMARQQSPDPAQYDYFRSGARRQSSRDAYGQVPGGPTRRDPSAGSAGGRGGGAGGWN